MTRLKHLARIGSGARVNAEGCGALQTQRGSTSKAPAQAEHSPTTASWWNYIISEKKNKIAFFVVFFQYVDSII